MAQVTNGRFSRKGTPKSLLTKTTRRYLFFTLSVLLVSIPVYFVVVDTIWLQELDEHNQIIADKTEYHLNQLNLSESELRAGIRLWNRIQPGTDIENYQGQLLRDSVFTIDKPKNYTATHSINRFRCLYKIIHVQGIPYAFKVETNIEESLETIVAITITTAIFLLILTFGFFLLNRSVSARIWKPFRNTLHQLKTFNLSKHTTITFVRSDILEFEELNVALEKVIGNSVKVFQSQKEFTENASHELQTPLAIIKNKLDLFLQDEDLTEAQYDIAEDINKALARSSRMNKGLLLLAKIENQQFAEEVLMNLNEIVQHNLDLLDEHFKSKKITLVPELEAVALVKGNSILAELLVGNMLANALRHTPSYGNVVVKLGANAFEVINSGEQALIKENLFKRFFRASADKAGNGLGLAIIKEIGLRHNWDVCYYYSKGSHHFKVTF